MPTGFYMSARNWNSGCQRCKPSALATDASPQSYLQVSLRSRLFLANDLWATSVIAVHWKGLYLKTRQCSLMRSKVDHCNSVNLSALVFSMRLSINGSGVGYIAWGRKLDCPPCGRSDWPAGWQWPTGSKKDTHLSNEMRVLFFC